MARDAIAEAIDAGAARYAAAGRVALGFARGKLRGDPVFRALIERGVAAAPSLADLGCGCGYLLAVVLAARGEIPGGTLCGIERAPRAVRRARLACGDGATIVEGDLVRVSIPAAAVITIVDVLHYLPVSAQDSLLERARSALPPGGRLLIRDADAGAGSGFAAVRLAERMAALARGDGWPAFAYRSADDLARRLEALGTVVSRTPMGQGTPFANVLLEARVPA